MSSLDTAINKINKAADDANASTDLLDKVVKGDKTQSFPDPSDPSVKIPSVAKVAHDAYLADKSEIDAAVQSAKIRAQNAEVSSNSAKDQTAIVTAKAAEVNSDAVEAAGSAAKAKAEADRASKITGLDTVDQAVEDALSRSYQYAMTKAEFDARREANKELYAGSGFVEWGKQYTGTAPDTDNVNNGIECVTSISSIIRMGFNQTGSGGISRSSTPLVLVDGTIHDLYNVGTGISSLSYIKFPPAPNGTKTYDSATGSVFDFTTQVDPKYGDIAPNTNEAVARAFEGMLKNGDFRLGADGWDKSGSDIWTFEDGKAIAKPTTTTTGYISQTRILRNTVLDVELVVLKGNVIVQAGNGTLLNKKFGVGTHKFQLTFSDSDSTQIFLHTSSNTGECVVDSFTVRAATNQVITTRKDLVFLESWHEDISEKGVVYPFGNVQFGATSWEGLSLYQYKVAKTAGYINYDVGYFKFGEWQPDSGLDTSNYMFVWSKLTEAQKAKLLSDPRNNIYYDPETKKLIQVRYRIRVEEGVDNNFNTPITKSSKYIWYRSDRRSGDIDSINSQGKKDNTGTNSKVVWKEECGVGQALCGNYSGQPDEMFAYEGKCFALPIALVQRLNQGAYHPVYNPFGCDKFAKSSEGYGNWYSKIGLEVTSLKQCFEPWNATGKTTTGKSVSGGYIDSPNGSGRPSNDPYKFYDAIYAGQVEDLRLSAHKQETNKLLEDSIRKAVAGEMRGKGKVPFLVKVDTQTSATSANVNAVGVSDSTAYKVGDFVYLETTTNTYRMVTVTSIGDSSFGFTPNADRLQNGKIIHHTWLTSEFDNLPWTDIIGSSEDISSVCPNGVTGVFNTKSGGELMIDSDVSTCEVLIGDGSTWVKSTVPIDADTNSISITVPSGKIALVSYSALSTFTNKSNLLDTVGASGDVLSTSRHESNKGNRLIGSTLGLVGKDTSNTECYLTTTKSTSSQIKYNSDGFTAPTNDSCKLSVIPSLVTVDGLLYLQINGVEGKWGGSSWGDGNTIDLISNEGTKTDLNGNTVKTFCHHSQIPLGIMSYSDSSQAS